MTDPNPIVQALDRQGYRLTAPRLAVADLILELDGHFTAAELVGAGVAAGWTSGAPRSFGLSTC